MTEHTITIDFQEPELPDTLVHRVRNLGEDIEHELLRGRDARVHDPDSATNQLRITVVSKRRVRRVLQLLADLLREHRFTGARVTVHESGTA